MAPLSLDRLSLLLADVGSSPGPQMAILREMKSILDSTSASLSSLAQEKINQLHADPSSPSMIQFYLQQIRRQQSSLRDLQVGSTVLIETNSSENQTTLQFPTPSTPSISQTPS